MKGLKGSANFDQIFKIIIWVVVFSILLFATYYIIKRLTG